jgi:hypothetical protein
MPRSKVVVPNKIKAQLVARGTGTVMYDTRPQLSALDAMVLVHKFLCTSRAANLIVDGWTIGRFG